MSNPERYRLFESGGDNWDEFLSWLYPRLSRAIDLYRDQGLSFDSYITGLLHNASKEYRCRESDHTITEYVCWQAKAEEMEAAETEPEYIDDSEIVSLPNGIKPRQVLYLLLKSYHFVSDEMVNRAAGVIGMDSKIIKDMIEEIRNRSIEKELEINEYVHRVHCQHYRYLAYQKRLNSSLPGTSHHDVLKERFERAKRRFFSMNKRLRGMRMNASNRMVAEVLGIPKGTVDSGMYAMRNHLAAFSVDALSKIS